jgi:hypothetical protein
MLETRWGFLPNTWWATFNTRVSKPLPNSTQPPTKKQIKPHKPYMHTPYSWFVRVTSKNLSKNKGFGHFRGCEKMGRKNGNGSDGTADGGTAVVR